MRKQLLVIVKIALILMLTACGSSPAKTDTAPVSEVVPTSSAPTQALFGLTVTVKSQDGNPIPWAAGSIQISGKDVSGKANNTGQLVWENLSGADGQLNVSAQGYTSSQQPLSLAAGANNLSVALELDSYQLNPAKVCQTGEKIIYVEDFEDGQAQDLDNIAAPKWNLISLEDLGLVMNVNSPGSNANTLIKSEFGNAVWQFEIMTSGVVDMNFNWHVLETTEGANTGLSRYYVSFKPGVELNLGVERPGLNTQLAESKAPDFEKGTWHTVAIAYYKGAISVWMDGQKAIDTTHDAPIEKGRFGFQINSATEGEIWLDNLIVCGLKEPYAPPIMTP